MVNCNSCNGSGFCSQCVGVGATQGTTGSVRCGRCLGSGKCPDCQQIRLLDLVRRPEPFHPTTVGRDSQDSSTTGRFPRGIVREDIEVHAVRKWIGGDQALCGAGPIATRLSGHFVPGAPGACRDCGYHAER